MYTNIKSFFLHNYLYHLRMTIVIPPLHFVIYQCMCVSMMHSAKKIRRCSDIISVAKIENDNIRLNHRVFFSIICLYIFLYIFLSQRSTIFLDNCTYFSFFVFVLFKFEGFISFFFFQFIIKIMGPSSSEFGLRHRIH